MSLDTGKKKGADKLSAPGSFWQRWVTCSVAGLDALEVLLGHPGHHAAQISTGLFDLVFFAGLEQGVVFLEAALVLFDPFFGELAGLDLFEDLLHLGFNLLVHNAGAAGDVAVFGGLGNGEAHAGDA